MPPSESPQQTVIDLATLLGLIAAWLYVAGWTYALHYFGHFEVGLLALDIPYEYYFMYGFWVLKAWWLAIVAGAVLIALGTFWHPRRPIVQQVSRLLLLGLVCVVFVGASRLGSSTATQHYETWSHADFPRHPRVKVWLKHDANDPGVMQDTAQEFPQGCYRLLVHNQSMLFLFRPRAGISQLRLSAVALPIAEIRAMRVIPQYDSCP